MRVLDGAIVIFTLTFLLMTYEDVNLYGSFAVVIGYAFYAIFFGAIVARVAKGGRLWLPVRRVPLAYAGKVIPYFVYLAHLPIVYMR